MFSIVHHTVADFNVWKSAYDSMEQARRSKGVKSGRVMQGAENPSEVFVILEWPDLTTAKEYFTSPGLKEALQKGGVQGEPDIWFAQNV